MNTKPTQNISLDTEFYPVTSVKQAVQDFREFFSASLVEVENRVALELAIKPQYTRDSATVLREFLNYTLDLSVKAHFTGDSK